MTTDPKPQHGEQPPDPSMEDILASIRRILDEEGAKPGDAAPRPAGDDPDVLDLDESMLLPDPDEAASGPVPAPPPILAEPLAMAEPTAEPEAAPAPVMPLAVPMPPPATASSPPAAAPSASAGALVAPEAAAAAAMSVGALMRTLASERSTAVHRGGPTIEDLVRAELRPLLKEWLDAHLAPMVERLVRAEIERVVSRLT